MNDEESQVSSPNINSVLKALNHPLRRELILHLYRKRQGSSFSTLHEIATHQTKSTGQFSYHLKLLLDAQIITKSDDIYFISEFGEKASNMIQFIDLEFDRSVSQKISSSFASLSPMELVFISWMITPLLIFGFIIDEMGKLNNDYISFYIWLTIAIITLISAILLSYSMLQYPPSVIVLTNIIWIFFLPKDQIKLGRIYIFSGFGTGILMNGLLLDNSLIQIVIGLISISIALFYSLKYIKDENHYILDIKIK
ncbi:MAG: helix-turn-helix domain-containing protein [Candidatus Heimdallarchaeota archaeon]|nr:helix-turn-helix domain-containing protein [Candidatus Heimdallarchaeota archaeon]MDH5645612.1 helix-turn-helix domain-containing protein [Candidatus Heimdallarchaeota archaeon]